MKMSSNEDKQALIAIGEDGVREWMAARGQPSYRSKQVMEAVKRGEEIGAMTVLPKMLREELSCNFFSLSLHVCDTLTEQKSSTKKFSFSALDGIILEGVSLIYKEDITQCISTQAGCRMHCSFCQSGRNGLIRSLAAHEMKSQLILVAKDAGKPVTNIVLMGSGEPLDNYGEVKSFLEDLREEGTSFRRITLSTCGIVPGIEKMIEDRLFVNLSISLHSPFHGARSRLMPVENAYPLTEVIDAARRFYQAGGRRVTYEYCVIEGENDSQKAADELARLLSGDNVLINLIDVNASGSSFKENSQTTVGRFEEKLRKNGLDVTVRRRLGSSINAACGQLTAYAQSKPE